MEEKVSKRVPALRFTVSILLRDIHSFCVNRYDLSNINGESKVALDLKLRRSRQNFQI